MDALLRQSRMMCPFLKSTCPATLRSLSTTTRRLSPGGGTISNLQIIARRCPVMGKAMAVQTAKSGGRSRLGGVMKGLRTYSAKAKLHTASSYRANVDVEPLRHRDNGMWIDDDDAHPSKLLTNDLRQPPSALTRGLLLPICPASQSPALSPRRQRRSSSITMAFTTPNSRRSTRTNRTATSIISTALRRNFLGRTCPTRRNE